MKGDCNEPPLCLYPSLCTFRDNDNRACLDLSFLTVDGKEGHPLNHVEYTRSTGVGGDHLAILHTDEGDLQVGRNGEYLWLEPIG